MTTKTEVNKREGFWYSSYETHLPKPEARPTPWLGQTVFLQELQYVEQLATVTSYRGVSGCRVCKCMNGSQEFSYKSWEWPSGLHHYVAMHNVKPTDAFIDFVHQVIMGKIAD